MPPLRFRREHDAPYQADLPAGHLLRLFRDAIQDENQKKGSITSTIFGDELHRYSIADGIRDKNVLGFDPYKVLTYRDADLREKIALEKAKAKTVQEAIADPKKSKVYYEYMTIPTGTHLSRRNMSI